MKPPYRDNFDYCWPGDAKVMSLDVTDHHVRVMFDRFTMTLDDPWNTSAEDLDMGECICRFLSPVKIEFRLWADEHNYKVEGNLSKLVGCTLENSGDMPSDKGHYFELTGFCDTEWFEFRIYAEQYELIFDAVDQSRIEKQANNSQHTNPIHARLPKI